MFIMVATKTPPQFNTLWASRMNQSAWETCETSMQTIMLIVPALQGRVVSPGLTRTHRALGRRLLQRSRASGSMSVHVTSHPFDRRREDHRPPSHPISRAAPGLAKRPNAHSTAFRSIWDTYAPHLVWAIFSQNVGPSYVIGEVITGWVTVVIRPRTLW